MSNPIPDSVSRFFVALNGATENDRLDSALTEDCTIIRWDPSSMNPVEEFHGIDSVRRWLERTPKGIAFHIDSTRECRSSDGDPPSIALGYQYEIVASGFRHGGEIRVRLSQSNLISKLEWIPDPLPD
ncbi:MAG: nuclear transport factor 2 family protein [Myxococcales bacterium]|nr:nuclear transport factor 2 family protein [Myxococcales bacterium]